MNPLDTPAPDDPSTHPADDSTGSVNPALIPHDAPTLPGMWAVEYERMAERREQSDPLDPVAAFDDVSMPTPIVPPAALNMDHFMEPPQPRTLPPVASETPAPPRRHVPVSFGAVALLVIGALVTGVLAGGALLHPSNPITGGRGTSQSRAGMTATTGTQATTSDKDASDEHAPGTSNPAIPVTVTSTQTPVSTKSTQPGPASTATATPIAPRLAISPTELTMTCTVLTQSLTVQVRNAGGGRLTWHAAPSDSHVQAQPDTGNLDAGESQTVTLSNSEILGQSFTVSFTSNGGSATLTVTCQTAG